MELKVGTRIKLVGKKDFTWADIAKPDMEGVIIETAPLSMKDNFAVDLDGIPRNHGGLGEGWWFSGENLEAI